MIMRKPLTPTLLFCLAGICQPTAAEEKPHGSSNDLAVKKLLDQASYWHSKAHDDIAMEALQKVLAVDDNNIDALYLLSLYQLQRGNTQQSARWRKKIAEIAPDDPRLNALNHANTLRTLPQDQLNAARQLAKQGNIKASIAAWRMLFKDNPPPDDVALEYYQTLAGDSAYWSEAVASMRQRVSIMPNDVATKLALAMALTYQPATRREGITLLEGLAPEDERADNALRQALLWLDATSSDLPAYSAYAQRHPHEQAPMEHYRKRVEGEATRAGFDALKGGDLAGAREKFSEALQTRPDNGTALAGIGYVSLRQENFDDAQRYLRRAAQSAQHNPDSGQWAKDADSARFYSALHQARALSKQGRYQQALSTLEGDTHDATQQLAAEMLRGDIFRQQGKLPEAEAIYSRLLTQYPQNSDIRSALWHILKQQNKQTEADAIWRTLPPELRIGFAAMGDNGEHERKAAQSALLAGEPSRALQLLQTAAATFPQNPWLQLDYARALRKAGQKQQAMAVVSGMAQRGKNRKEMLYAAALFAAEERDWPRVQRLLARIPKRQHSADIAALSNRAQQNQQLDVARHYLRAGNPHAARNSLLTLKRTPPQAPLEVGDLAELLMQSGDSSGALQLIRQSQAQGLHGSLADYAGHIRVLTRAGLFAEAESILHAPMLQEGIAPEEKHAIRIGNVIVRADRLREQGESGRAWKLLMPELQINPTQSDLLLAMGRVYQAERMYDKAREIYQFVLRRSPREREALIGLTQLALARGEGLAARQAFASLEPSQQADYMLLAARVAAANGENRRAMRLLRSIQWRLQKDAERSDRVPEFDAPLHAPARKAQPGAMQDIAQLMRELQEKSASWAQAGVAFRSRSGEGGLSALDEVQTPLILSGAIGESTRLSLHVTPTSLHAGKMTSQAASRFGSGPLEHAAAAASPSPAPTHATAQGSQQSNGVAAALALGGESYTVDIGTTPTGGEFTRLVGGVEWRPRLTANSALTLKAERRAVNDSLLSSVGVKDKRSGVSWGGVTRNGLSAQYAWDNSVIGFYTGLGFDTIGGSNVPLNHALTAQAGSYLRPWRSDDSELKVGVNIHYMDYAHNLSYHTLGHGGYFSPQNFMSLSLPVTWRGRFDHWDLQLNSALGYQSYRQASSDYFPGYRPLQDRLNRYASGNEEIDTRYKSAARHGVGYTFGVTARYYLSESLALGAELAYDTFGRFNEGKALLYFKYFGNQDE